MLLALGAVFMPFSWMDAIHRFLTMGPLPDAPITRYLAWSLSAFYAFMGAAYVVMSFDVTRYRPVIRFFATVGCTCGLAFPILDYGAGMPWFWIAAEGPIVLCLSAAILWLATRAPEEGRP